MDHRPTDQQTQPVTEVLWHNFDALEGSGIGNSMPSNYRMEADAEAEAEAEAGAMEAALQQITSPSQVYVDYQK